VRTWILQRFTYDAMLHAFSLARYWRRSLALLRRMGDRKISLSATSMSAAINTCGSSLQWLLDSVSGNKTHHKDVENIHIIQGGN
jgi:pentatricopeptide repeat protein